MTSIPHILVPPLICNILCNMLCHLLCHPCATVLLILQLQLTASGTPPQTSSIKASSYIVLSLQSEIKLVSSDLLLPLNGLGPMQGVNALTPVIELDKSTFCILVLTPPLLQPVLTGNHIQSSLDFTVKLLNPGVQVYSPS